MVAFSMLLPLLHPNTVSPGRVKSASGSRITCNAHGTVVWDSVSLPIKAGKGLRPIVCVLNLKSYWPNLSLVAKLMPEHNEVHMKPSLAWARQQRSNIYNPSFTPGQPQPTTGAPHHCLGAKVKTGIPSGSKFKNGILTSPFRSVMRRSVGYFVPSTAGVLVLHHRVARALRFASFRQEERPHF